MHTVRAFSQNSVRVAALNGLFGRITVAVNDASPTHTGPGIAFAEHACTRGAGTVYLILRKGGYRRSGGSDPCNRFLTHTLPPIELDPCLQIKRSLLGAGAVVEARPLGPQNSVGKSELFGVPSPTYGLAHNSRSRIGLAQYAWILPEATRRGNHRVPRATIWAR